MRGTLLPRHPGNAHRRFIPAHAGNTTASSAWPIWAAVHPRACGEHPVSNRQFPHRTGSSPRMRGTRVTERINLNIFRFIPAHAGNTDLKPEINRQAAVHPRACGEHSAGAIKRRWKYGSSPRMRGTLAIPIRTADGGRFIPAHAGNTLTAARARSARTVHPRACGEHGAEKPVRRALRGSSPRMRGTLIVNLERALIPRFIPAHAGNTSGSELLCAYCPVHPRACGEHQVCREIALHLHGSSPRMRGTPHCGTGQLGAERFIPAHAGNTAQAAVGNLSSRFIPAHAGNTYPLRAIHAPCPVHPRACGEHKRRSQIMATHRGSSPRMRGTRAHPSRPERCSRFIPAHAGNTFFRSLAIRQRPVHPRACGEHAGRAAACTISSGSSPRMRGTRRSQEWMDTDGRFIPAHAGNTPSISAWVSSTPVHPRACGEHFATIARTRPVLGSSPRMRGTLLHLEQRTGDLRFIPAHAGNTAVIIPNPPPRAVHPRACGEHVPEPVRARELHGSSPRMRGTHQVQDVTMLGWRFIPAHAGNTF